MWYLSFPSFLLSSHGRREAEEGKGESVTRPHNNHLGDRCFWRLTRRATMWYPISVQSRPRNRPTAHLLNTRLVTTSAHQLCSLCLCALGHRTLGSLQAPRVEGTGQKRLPTRGSVAC